MPAREPYPVIRDANMKKTSKKKPAFLIIFALVSVLNLNCRAASAEEAAGMQKIQVPADVTEISVELENDTDVTLVKTPDILNIESLKYEGAQGNPVTVERKGNKITLSVKGGRKWWKFKVGTLVASFRLLVPEGRSVKISGGKLKLSGELAGTDLRVNAGNLTMAGLSLSASNEIKVAAGHTEMDMTVLKAKKFSLSAGHVSGKVRMPESVEYKNSSGSNDLKVMLLEGK